MFPLRDEVKRRAGVENHRGTKVPKIKIVNISRADDERLLKFLRTYAVGGLTADAVGQRFGVTKSAVVAQINRVKKADLAESGEPEVAVSSLYVRGGGIPNPAGLLASRC